MQQYLLVVLRMSSNANIVVATAIIDHLINKVSLAAMTPSVPSVDNDMSTRSRIHK